MVCPLEAVRLVKMLMLYISHHHLPFHGGCHAQQNVMGNHERCRAGCWKRASIWILLATTAQPALWIKTLLQ